MAQNDQPPSLGESVTPSKNTWGEEFGNIDTNKVNSVNLRGKATIPALRIGDDTYLSNANVENITRNKNKEMVLDVEYQESKTDTMTNDQFEKELKKATEEAGSDDEATKEAAFTKLAAYQMASEIAGGGKKVTYPSKNRRKVVVIQKEDEADVAGQLRMNIDEVDSKIYKDPNEANKKPVYKGLDKDGNPIFE